MLIYIRNTHEEGHTDFAISPDLPCLICIRNVMQRSHITVAESFAYVLVNIRCG